MGLGKTVQSIAASSLFPSLRPVLVIAPSGARRHWQEEYKRWCPGLRSQVISAGSDRISSKADVIIVSYGLVGALMKRGTLTKWKGMAIVDESHMLKSRKSKRSKAAMELLAEVRTASNGNPTHIQPLHTHTPL